MAHAVDAVSSTPDTRSALEAARGSLRALEEFFASRHGSVTDDPEEMAAVHRSYWGSLFQSPSWDLASSTPPRQYDPIALPRLLQHTTARLSEQDRRMLDAPITANDFYWAISHSPKGRSAG
ncbi:unnamed protein product [Peronospora effusa]|nr:unnamed protein product [Peronospora effusa]